MGNIDRDISSCERVSDRALNIAMECCDLGVVITCVSDTASSDWDVRLSELFPSVTGSEFWTKSVILSLYINASHWLLDIVELRSSEERLSSEG